ncbi:MAG: BrnA antitoxin family protein [Mesorhizobium sp.]
MKEAGELFHDPKAPEGESLGAEFWAKAAIEEPKRPRSVHLKLDPDVFEFFRQQAGGKGHLTKMQAVLKAYANAHRP